VTTWQDFAEKPKGDALEKMKVDTTVLGELTMAVQDIPLTGAFPTQQLRVQPEYHSKEHVHI